MSSFKDASVGAKMMIVAVVGMLLAIGLCGAGGVAEDHHLSIADLMMPAGAFLFFACVFLALMGLILFLLDR